MAQLAIKGHATRGKEVIEILEMLGGKDVGYSGIGSQYYYYIDEYGNIAGTTELPNNKTFVIYTLEKFLEKFPYKIGDKVQSKGATSCGTVYVIEHMKWANNYIEYKIRPLYDYYHTGLGTLCVEDLQPYKEETMEIPEKLMPKIDFNEYCKDKYILDLGNYEIKEENGKTYAVRKWLEYPKTYEECCDVLGLSYMQLGVVGYACEKLGYLQRLLLYRQAYWKIAGEQMGLGKPWEPDWKECSQPSHCIIIEIDNFKHLSHILAFPTSEMLDAFYENFKDLIEQCKELL